MFGERDSRFFQLFADAATNVAEASQMLLSIVCDPAKKEQLVTDLEELEHKGDELTHDILAELNRAFITPIDREDIFLIAKETDNIIDTIEATAHRFIMFDIKETTTSACQLAEYIIESSQQLVEIMHSLRKLKHIVTDNKAVVEINRIEDTGDKVYRQAVRELYTGGQEPLDVIKWREILDHLEDTLDAFEDVANIVEGIAMKHT